MGQIPRFTERISSLLYFSVLDMHQDPLDVETTSDTSVINIFN